MELKIATYNVALNAASFCKKSDRHLDPESLTKALANKDDFRLNAIAKIVLDTHPDIILLNEFDFIAPQSQGLDRFCEQFLEISAAPLHYPYRYTAPVNTGLPVEGFEEKVHGFGHYPGQYGMAVLSRYPLRQDASRTFQRFRWADMPGALQPQLAGRPYYPEALWQRLRLSSKSHWDLCIDVAGQPLHILASHPTPPVFDGAEKRNQRRNFDEIRFWADYITTENSHYIVDDQGRAGGLAGDVPFVILGDLNADPSKGQSWPGAIDQLLKHPLVNSGAVPQSEGGKAKGRADITADWGLRADYVLPSKRGLMVVESGVYWPLDKALQKGLMVSDHRLVWTTLALLP